MIPSSKKGKRKARAAKVRRVAGKKVRRAKRGKAAAAATAVEPKVKRKYTRRKTKPGVSELVNDIAQREAAYEKKDE